MEIKSLIFFVKWNFMFKLFFKKYAKAIRHDLGSRDWEFESKVLGG